MKYDTQIGELKNKLDQSNSVLVMLPTEVTTDKLAAALALYLSLKQSGKSVSIISEAEIKVGDSNLFGVGDIKKELPENNSGNFILGLEGVVENGKVPALSKLDWHPSGNNLNLVFHVVPGQKFEPINITHHYETSAFQIIFFIGAPTLVEFGLLYTSNIEKLGDGFKVNLDNSQNNNLFGNINITDSNQVCLSEMVSLVIQGLGLNQDTDIATNLILGIYAATSNLTQNVSGDTFIAIGQAMQMGGKVPNVTTQVNSSGFDIRQFSQVSQPKTDEPEKPVESLVSPEAVQEAVEAGSQPLPAQETSTSLEETPTGEFATSSSGESPSPDWLTPKIFKGGGLG